jgi:hypothetical protein
MKRKNEEYGKRIITQHTKNEGCIAVKDVQQRVHGIAHGGQWYVIGRREWLRLKIKQSSETQL